MRKLQKFIEIKYSKQLNSVSVFKICIDQLNVYLGAERIINPWLERMLDWYELKQPLFNSLLQIPLWVPSRPLNSSSSPAGRAACWRARTSAHLSRRSVCFTAAPCVPPTTAGSSSSTVGPGTVTCYNDSWRGQIPLPPALGPECSVSVYLVSSQQLWYIY